MSTVLPFQNSMQSRTVEHTKKRVKELSKLHPVALVVIAGVSILIIAGALFTGYHNWELFSRGTSSQGVALIPPLLLDGSMVLLLLGFIFWFADKTQKIVAGLFNFILFVIVALNTSLNASLNTGRPLTSGLSLYLQWGLYGAFLFTLGAWMLIIHLDPLTRRQEEKSALGAETFRSAHEAEVETLTLELQRQQAELQYQAELARATHTARMKALGSEDVQSALLDFEKQQAVIEARQIRGLLPK